MPWLMTYLLHSTLLILTAALVGRLLSDRWLAVKESVWRVALFGGLLTASLQTGLGLEPLSGSWALAASAEPASSAPAVAPLRVGTVLAGVDTTPIEPVSAAPLPWNRWAMLAWLVIAALSSGALLVSYLRLERKLRGRRLLDHGPVCELFRRVLAAARVRRPVRLTASRRIAIPLAKGLPQREICLPERVVSRLSPEQQETVLAHELAHLERRDPQWLIGLRLLESVLFFQPLNRWARRELQEIAEYRCDDWAVRHTGRPVSLARCLASVAEWTLDERRALLAPALAARRRTLKQRVDRLLDRSYPRPEEPRPRWLLPVSAALIVLTVLVAPGFSVAERAQDEAPARAEAPAEATPEAEASTTAEPTGAPQTPPTPLTPTVAPTPEIAPVPRVAPTPTVAPVSPVEPTPVVAPAPAVPPAAALFDEEQRKQLEAELRAAAAALEAEMPRIQAEIEAHLADLEIDMEATLATAAAALEDQQLALEMAERVELEAREEIEAAIEAAEEAEAVALEALREMDVEALREQAMESLRGIDFEAIRREAQRAAEQARPTAEELEAMRSELRRLHEERRTFQRDELQELREQLRQLHEELRIRERERSREGDPESADEPRDR